MIDLERLDALRNVPLCDVHEVAWLEIMDTMAALYRVVRAADIMDRLICFGDKIYDVRESEGLGWEGPNVVAYGKACKEFGEGIAPFRPAPTEDKSAGRTEGQGD